MTNLAQLDYEPVKLMLEANTQMEQKFRVPACAKEPWTVQFIESIPEGGVFWDIGANVGSYTLVAAARGLAVVAVEPVPVNFATLIRNLAYNRLTNRVMPVCLALGAGRGSQWLGYRLGSMGSGSATHLIGDAALMAKHRLQVTHAQPILTIPLDDAVEIFALPAPTHVKLDVDGGEMDVLTGMARALTGDTLQGLMVELGPDREQAITAYLAERGWDLAERFAARGIAYGRYARPVQASASWMAPGSGNTEAERKIITAGTNGMKAGVHLRAWQP